METKIKFRRKKDVASILRGKTFLLIGSVEKGGAIATREQYENFEMSTAHWYPGLGINRHGTVIGKREDFEVVSK